MPTRTTRKQRKLRKHQKQKKQRGGKVIGEGSYGIVVHPAIPCEGRNVSRKVSKVFKKKENIRENKQHFYRNFAIRKAELEPIIEKLRELDPDQIHFIRPEFCERYGELTNELKTNGITNESKQNSYLMVMGGISFNVISNFFSVLELAYTSERIHKIKSLAAGNNSVATEHETILFSAMAPLVKQMIEIMDKLHEAGLLHGDLHTGNILLNYDDPHIDLLFSKMREFNVFLPYIENENVLTPEQIEIIFKSVRTIGFGTVDLGKVTIQIIDWDRAKIVDPSENEDSLSEETHDILFYMLPGPLATQMLEKYLSMF